jgi:hypothetical protein
MKQLLRFNLRGTKDYSTFFEAIFSVRLAKAGLPVDSL